MSAATLLGPHLVWWYFSSLHQPFPIRRRIHVHPEFEWWLVHNDFALLELRSPVDLAAHRHVRPICYSTQQPRAGDVVGREGGITSE